MAARLNSPIERLGRASGMTGWAWAAIFLLLLIVAGGGWLGYSWLRSRPVSDKAVVQTATDAQDQSLVYIQKIEQQDGAIYVTVDPVEWYVGSQADDMARQDGLCQASTTGCVTNGFYLRNATTTTSMLLLNAQAKVEMQTLSQTASGTPRWDQSVSLQTWIDLFADSQSHWHKIPFRLTIRDNEVMAIREQYLP